MSDDSDDKPHSSQESSNRQEYRQWHSLIVADCALIPLERDWTEIKKRYDIDYLHCSENHRQLLTQPVSPLRNEIHNFLRKYKVQHFFSLESDESRRAFVDSHKDGEKFRRIKHDWDLKDPKDFALFWHLVYLDRRIGREIKPEECHVFVDRTTRSDSKFKTVPLGGAWGYRTHPGLETIHQEIASKVHKQPVDMVGRCLDLADYSAWGTRLTLLQLKGRDYAKGREFTPGEYQKCLDALSLGERDMVEQFAEDISCKRIQDIGNWDLEPIKN